MLLEARADGSRRNRIVELRNGKVTAIEGIEGGLGHLDMGLATPSARIRSTRCRTRQSF
jgi:hypothetical protein